MRYFLDISYLGTRYHGWQIQKNAISIQEAINEKISTLLKREIKVVGSSRTDTGVHAIQQFCHFDIDKKINIEVISNKLNAFLPTDISLNQIFPVVDDAHSRFDAVSRTYEYRICRSKNPFQYDRTYLFFKKLDIDLMNEGAELLLREKNFQSFSKVKTDVNNFDCNITYAKWNLKSSNLNFKITSNRFLRGMVRAIVGTLLEVGEEKISIRQFKNAIKSRNRNKAGSAVPAKGLYLTHVKYPRKIYLNQKI